MLLGLGKTLTFGQKKIYPYATGGDYVYLYEDTATGKTYRVHEFLSTGTSTLNVEVGGQMDILVVGGGGSGGRGDGNCGAAGGGGAGKMIEYSVKIETGTCSITIGAGGASRTTNGQGNDGSSSIFSSGTMTITGVGGGGGGGNATAGRSGGSGGGGGCSGQLAGTASAYTGVGIAYGNNGGTGLTYEGGGGGGGADSVGSNATTSGAGNGGNGKQWLNGKYYAGGGGGAAWYLPHILGTGGLGGGGDGASPNASGAGEAGTPNTGGGGGGGMGGASGAGGSGIVIVRYEIDSFPSALEENEEIFYYYDSASDGFIKTHWFSEVGENSIFFTEGGPVTVTLIGGGGGGGHAGIGSVGNYSNNFVWAGGGGAGGVLQTTLRVSKGSTLTFNIGAGGSGGVDGYRGSNGEDTTFNGLTAFGGGGGGGGRSNNFSGNNGGCGGGAATYGCCVLSVSGGQNGGSGVSGQGYGGGLATGNNGYGGGGGGAGASGNANNVVSDKGRGGDGKLLLSRYFGGGGGAGSEGGSIGQIGGAGGGGWGAASRTPGGNGTNGVNGYGGGGGGGSFYNSGNGFLPGNGGNGGVLVSYYASKETVPYVTDGLVLNLDAGDYASYPGSGTTWYDISGNGNNFTLDNASAFQTSNGISYMNFEGSYGIARKAGGGDLSNYSNGTIMVFSSILSSTTTWRTLVRGNSCDHHVIIRLSDSLLGMYDNNNGGQFRSSGFNFTNIPNATTKFNCLTFKLSQSSPYWSFQYNDDSNKYTITDSSATFNCGFGYIGGYQGGPSQYWGKIAVFLYYNRHLSDSEIQQNFNALRGRYGV